MHRMVPVCFLVIALLPGPRTARAGPPLMTDDPGTPGHGNWEINLASAAEKRQTEVRLEAPILDINYGWGDRIQLNFEIPWVFLDEEGNGTSNGLGNSVAGVKCRFLDEKSHGVSASVHPQLEFNNPGSSSHERGLADEGIGFALPVQVARGFGPVALTLEAGYTFSENESDEWLFGLALGHRVSGRLELVGELAGTASKAFDEQELVFNLGGRWRILDPLVLNASAGRGLYSSEGPDVEFLSYLGLQLLF